MENKNNVERTVDNRIQNAKNNYHKMLNSEAPGLEYLEIEGVDWIPLGGNSGANPKEKDKE